MTDLIDEDGGSARPGSVAIVGLVEERPGDVGDSPPSTRRGLLALALTGAVFAIVPPLGLARSNAFAAATGVWPWGLVAGLVLALIAVAAGSISRRLTAERSARPGVTAAALFSLVFFGYGMVAAAANQLGIGSLSGRRLAWLAVTLALTGAVGTLHRRRPVVPILLLLTVLAMGRHESGVGSMDALERRLADQRSAAVDAYADGLVERPNIYFLMTDGFVRADQLERFTGHSGRPLETALADRGFAVSARMRANYPLTLLSLASTLQLDYVATDRDDLASGPGIHSRTMRGENAVVDVLAANGYSYAHAEPGDFLATRCPERVTNICIPPSHGEGARPGESFWALLATTPLRDTIDRLRDTVTLDDGYTEPASVLEAAFEAPEPRFVLAHIHQPHPPYRYERDCSLHPTAGGPVWRREDVDGYLDEYLCVADQLTQAVDTILADDPDAVIVIQSDHGSAFSIDWPAGIGVWGPNQYRERFAVFSAIRLPERCRERAESVLTLVNTFDAVLGCLADRPPDPVEDRYFVRIPKPFINLDEFRWAEAVG